MAAVDAQQYSILPRDHACLKLPDRLSLNLSGDGMEKPNVVRCVDRIRTLENAWS